MPPESLRCKECNSSYDLDASYVCEQCFGPLEVAYAPRDDVDAGGAEAPNPGRATLAVALRGLSCRSPSPPPGTLHAGWTPLIRADRLAAAARAR